MAGGGLTVDAQRKSYADIQKYFQQDKVLQRISREISNRLLTPEKLTQFMLTAATKNRMLLECTPESLCEQLQRAATIGLAPNGVDGHLVPFRNNKKGITEVVFIPDYKGLIKLMYQSGLVTAVFAAAVRAKDRFEYRFGNGSSIEHRPFDADTLDGRGPLKHAWALAELKGGGCPFVVLSRAEVMARKKASRGSDSQYSPWSTAEDSMWAKSAVRQLSKFVPLTPDMAAVIDADTKQEYGDNILDVESMAAGSVPLLEDESDEDQEEDAPPPQTRTQRLAERAAEAKKAASTKPATKANIRKPEPEPDPEEDEAPADEGIDEPAPEEESQEQPQEEDQRDRQSIMGDFEEQLYSCADEDELDAFFEHNITFNQHKLKASDRKYAENLVARRKEEMAEAATAGRKGAKR